MLFTMILIISFFCTLSTGAMTGDMSAGLSWLDLVPFTAVLVTPSRILLDMITLTEGLLSLAILLIVTFVFIWFAGKIYKMMSLYKGNLLKPAEIFAMLKDTRKET